MCVACSSMTRPEDKRTTFLKIELLKELVLWRSPLVVWLKIHTNLKDELKCAGSEGNIVWNRHIYFCVYREHIWAFTVFTWLLTLVGDLWFADLFWHIQYWTFWGSSLQILKLFQTFHLFDTLLVLYLVSLAVPGSCVTGSMQCWWL